MGNWFMKPEGDVIMVLNKLIILAKTIHFCLFSVIKHEFVKKY